MADRAERIAEGSTAHALELEGVSRHFGALVALDSVDLAVKAGERRAVLGANGAARHSSSTASPAISRRPGPHPLLRAKTSRVCHRTSGSVAGLRRHLSELASLPWTDVFANLLLGGEGCHPRPLQLRAHERPRRHDGAGAQPHARRSSRTCSRAPGRRTLTTANSASSKSARAAAPAPRASFFFR